MHKTSRFSFVNRIILVSAFALVIFGSVMIVSAEMGNAAGETDYLKRVALKQIVFVLIGVVAYFIASKIKLNRISLFTYNIGYYILLVCLLACRLFGETNGAYAWIRLGSNYSIQPSEFAKIYMIIYGAKLLGKDCGEKNSDNLKRYAIMALVYVGIICFVQRDFGSGIVLAVICYFVCMIPPYKELKKFQHLLFFVVLIGILLIVIVFSNFFTNLLREHFGNHYIVGRFLAAANPFLDRYDNGYHIIMSLVSFANGSIFGLGFGNSIHKYMNFPNPSNDFILPVIVEELGIFGFLGIVLGYCLLLVPIMSQSIKTTRTSTRIVLLGVFSYFIVHFILNVGGVSGFIPLTGVPLLLISSGGSSMIASLIGLGFVQSEIIKEQESKDEDNSRQV